MMQENDDGVLNSDVKIKYSCSELNAIAAFILSSLVDCGSISFEEGFNLKMFFNTVISTAVNQQDVCDEFLESVPEWEKSMGIPDDFDIIKAAQDLSNKYQS